MANAGDGPALDQGVIGAELKRAVVGDVAGHRAGSAVGAEAQFGPTGDRRAAGIGVGAGQAQRTVNAQSQRPVNDPGEIAVTPKQQICPTGGANMAAPEPPADGPAT